MSQPGSSASELWSSRVLLAVGLALISLGVVVMIVNDISAGTAVGTMLSSEDIMARTASSAVSRGVELLLFASGGLVALVGAVAEGVRLGTMRARAEMDNTGRADAVSGLREL